MELLSSLENFDIPTDKVIFFDTETSGLDPHTDKLLLISMRYGGTTYVLKYHRDMNGQLRYILTLNKVVAHHMPFDWGFVYKNIGVRMENCYCTKIAERVILAGYPGYDYSLKSITERRLGKKLEKEVRESFIGVKTDDYTFTQEQIEYSAQDVDVLEDIYNQQQEDIRKFDLERVIGLENSLIPVTSRMTFEGIAFHGDVVRSYIPSVAKVRDRAEQDLQDLFIQGGVAENILFFKGSYNTGSYRTVKLSSSKQVLEALNAVGIDVKSTGKKELSSWASANSDQDSEYDDGFNVGFSNPYLRAKAIFAGTDKLLSSYYETLPKRVNKVTGRIHPWFDQVGTTTGRYSGNLQQLPNDYKLKNLGLTQYSLRQNFYAPPGRKFIIADFGGQELGILALYSGDKNLIEQMLKGDAHSYVAKRIFNVPDDQWNRKQEPYSTMRDVIKSFNFGLIYGSTARNFQRTLYQRMAEVGIDLTVEMCEQWMYVWMHEIFPDTGAFLQECEQKVITDYYVTTISGRRRNWVMDIRENKWRMFAAQREGKNLPVQGSGADITKLSMVWIARDLHPDDFIVMTVHDEVVIEVDESRVEDSLRITEDNMIKSVSYWFKDAPKGIIRVEPAVSDCYNK